MKKRAAIIIDGPNAKASANAAGFQVDYKKLLDFYSQEFDVFRAMYFTALPPRAVEAPIHKLTDWLGYNGYNVISKETKEYEQLDGSVKTKGNMDVEITVHTLELSKHVHELIFFTGDGDFRFLLETVQRSGLRATVIAARGVVSDDLRKQADRYVDLADMRNKFDQNLDVRRRRFVLE